MTWTFLDFLQGGNQHRACDINGEEVQILKNYKYLGNLFENKW